MRVRDFAAAIEVDSNQALAAIASLGMPNAPVHANSGIPEDVFARLQQMYPQLANVDTADSPEVAEEVAAPVAAASVLQAGVSQVSATPPVPAVTVPESSTVVSPKSDSPKDRADPEARSLVTRNAHDRQSTTLPGPTKKKWRVSYPGWEDSIVSAFDEGEAWAVACEQKRKFPGPRGRTVTEIQ